jgi:hypothetical protein
MNFFLVVFVTPFVTTLTLMCIAFFVQGVAQGFTDLGKSINREFFVLLVLEVTDNRARLNILKTINICI